RNDKLLTPQYYVTFTKFLNWGVARRAPTKRRTGLRSTNLPDAAGENGRYNFSAIHKGKSPPSFFSRPAAYTFMSTAKSQEAIPLDLNSVTSPLLVRPLVFPATTSESFLTPVQQISSP